MTRKEPSTISDSSRKHLFPNPSRTENMVMGNSRKWIGSPLLIWTKQMRNEADQANKGIIVDEGLSWKDQYISLLSKLTGSLSSLRKLKDILPHSKLCDAYLALFTSYLRYGDVIRESPLRSTNIICSECKTHSLVLGQMLMVALSFWSLHRIFTHVVPVKSKINATPD